MSYAGPILWNISFRVCVHWRIQRGGCGGCNPRNPPLNFQKKKLVVIRVAVVIYLVVTSSNNVCLCALNGAKIGTAIVHYYYFLPGGAA